MKQKGYTSQVVRNAFFQGLSGVISKLGALVFTIVVARMLFPELFGIYSLALSMIMILSTVIDFGLGQTMVRYIAESLGKKKKKEARSRFLFIFKFKFFIALAVSILLFLFAGLLAAAFKKPDLILPLQIGSIYLFITALYGITSSLFLAVQKVKYRTAAEAIFQASRVGLIFVFLYFYKIVASVFVVLTISVLLTLIFTFVIINKKFSFLIRGRREPVERRRLLTFSGFLALGMLSILIFTNIDKLMLGYFLPSQFIGYYTAIITLVGGVFGLVAFGMVVFPVFTQLKGARLKRAFKKTFRWLALIAIPAAIGLAYVMLQGLQILYGQAYVPVQYRAALLLASIFLSFLVLETVLSSLYIMLFNAREKPKFPALTMIASSVLNIALNFIFIYYLIQIRPEYGLVGAAAATFISRYINFGALIVLSKRRLKIIPDKSSIFKPLAASLIMLAFLFVFNHFVNLNILYGIIMIVLAITVYIGVMWLIKGIKKEDIEIFKFLKYKSMTFFTSP